MTVGFTSVGTKGSITKGVVFEKTDLPNLFNPAFGDKMKNQSPGVFYDSSLDKYEGKSVSFEKMNVIKESLKKPGFPGITTFNK